MNEGGIESLTIAKISEFADLKRTSTYKFFETPDEIKQALIKRYIHNCNTHLKKNLTKGRTVNYFHEHQDKIHSGIIFNYHLKIDNTNFCNMDGEVESFISEDAFEIYKLLESNTLKPNCIIPIADFFLRNMNDLFSKKLNFVKLKI